MREEEVCIQSGNAELKGTLCTPDKEGRYPAVLMVHGSGALDRNENMKGQQLNIFNAIAYALADHGIASLRYDKRGCGKSSGDFMQAGHADLVHDATSCLDALAGSDHVSDDELYILGHSEGCIIAPQIALRCPSVSGMILLCPFLEDMEAILHRQAAQLEEELYSTRGITGLLYRVFFTLSGRPSTSQQRLIEKVRATDSSVVRAGLKRFPAKWLREILALNAVSIFAKTSTPMLLIGGEKDLQCDPEDVFRIADISQGPSETVLIDNMTHILRVDKKPASVLGSARLVGQPVEQAVMDTTARWILADSGSRQLPHANNASFQ